MGRGGDTFRAAPFPLIIILFLPFPPLVTPSSRRRAHSQDHVDAKDKLFAGWNTSEQTNSASLCGNSVEIVSCRVGSGCVSCLVIVSAKCRKIVRISLGYVGPRGIAKRRNGRLNKRPVLSGCLDSSHFVRRLSTPSFTPEGTVYSAVFVQKQQRVAEFTGAIWGNGRIVSVCGVCASV